MKQIYYTLVFLFFLTACKDPKSSKPEKKLTGKIQSDMQMLLPDGNVKADIMDGVVQSPRQVELTSKFQTAIKENYDWFLEYIKTIPEGEPMPYHEKLGMSKEEYTELMGFMDNIELVSSGKEDIRIETKDDLIRFKSNNKLAALDFLTIDLKNNIVAIRQYKMVFSDTVNITSDKNGLRSKWKGYRWKFEEPKDFGIKDFKDLSALNVIQYEFTIGRLEKNGKTFMSLKGREVENGAKTVDFELPVQF